MKIAHISAHYRPIIGGQEVYISNLINVCQNAGHASRVYQLYRGERGDDATCYPRVPFLPRYIPDFERRWLNLMVAISQPSRLLDADAVISHYALQARALERIRHKTIILSHGVEWSLGNPKPHDQRCEEYARRCLTKFRHVVNDTHYLRVLGMSAEPRQGYFEEIAPGIRFIPNCVDTNLFKPGPGLPEFAGRKLILVPRQIVKARGIHLAIEAFQLISKKDTDVQMCLLGMRHKGARNYLARLKSSIERYKLANRVFFCDPVPNREMPPWYNSAAVVLVPTIEREGTSLSAIEAMCCARPTVTTRVAGLADLPSHQCAPTAESIASALLEALDNQEDLGSDQYNKAVTTFNLTNWSNAWLNVVESL